MSTTLNRARGHSRSAGIIIALLIVVAAALLLMAGRQPAKASLADRVRSVAVQLRCPVCQGESVYDSPSGLAQSMRGVIRRRLAEGQTVAQVKAYFVARYGPWILLAPPASGIGGLVWFGPPILLICGLIGLGFLIFAWSRRGVPIAAVDSSFAQSHSNGRKPAGEPVPAGQPSLAAGSTAWADMERATGAHIQASALQRGTMPMPADDFELALDQLEQALADGSIARDEYDSRRQALERYGPLVATEATASGTSRVQGMRSAVILAAGVVVITTMVVLALQPRRSGPITGSVGASPPATSIPGRAIPRDIRQAQNYARAHPNQPFSWIRLATRLQQHRQYPGAMQSYARALQLSPHSEAAHLGLGFLELERGNSRAALSQVLAVQRRDPRSSRAALLEGMAYAEMPGQRRRSLAAFHRFLALAPHTPLRPMVLTWLHRLRGKAT